MKTSGAEWKQFITDDPYWDDMWIEHWSLLIDGIEYTEESDLNLSEDIADTAIIQINSGEVVGERTEQVFTLKSFFKKWKTKQTTKKFIVEIPLEKETEFRELIKNSKLGKIVG